MEQGGNRVLPEVNFIHGLRSGMGLEELIGLKASFKIYQSVLGEDEACSAWKDVSAAPACHLIEYVAKVY